MISLICKEMATHSSILAWEIPCTEEPGKPQSMGLQRVRHDLVTEHTHSFLQVLCQFLLACKVSAVKSADGLMGVLFYLLVVSLMLLLRSLFIFRVYLVVNIFGSILFGTLCASWSWMSVSFPRLSSVQFSSVSQLRLTPCDPMNHSTPGLPVHHQLPEFTETHVH